MSFNVANADVYVYSVGVLNLTTVSERGSVMKDCYTKEKGTFSSDDESFRPSSFAENTVFHVGQSYDDKPADTVICKECGSDKFNVGHGSCLTAIRCVVCEWEKVVHDG